MVLYNKDVKQETEDTLFFCFITILIVWLKKQVESILMFFWYISFLEWAPPTEHPKLNEQRGVHSSKYSIQENSVVKKNRKLKWN